MRALVFLKDTSKLKQTMDFTHDEGEIYQPTDGAPNLTIYPYRKKFMQEIHGVDVECCPMYAFLRHNGNYIGIQALVEGLVSMAGGLNLSKGCCIIEAEVDSGQIGEYIVNGTIVTEAQFRDAYYKIDSTDTLSAFLTLIPNGRVTAIYKVEPKELNVLHVTNTVNSVINLASCCTELYTDGFGELFTPDSNGSFELFKGSIETVIANHGQQYLYDYMTARMVNLVCARNSMNDPDGILNMVRKVDDPSTKIGDLLNDSVGSNSEDS